MTTIRTAISLPASVFDQANALAQELKVSRSKLFSMALEEYVERRHNRRLLQEINVSYTPQADEEDRILAQNIRARYTPVAPDAEE